MTLVLPFPRRPRARTRLIAGAVLALGCVVATPLVGRAPADARVAEATDRSGWIAGSARVTDGDGLRIGEARIRLHGVDAFERGQICGRSPCGEASRRNLITLTEGRRVECEPLDRDRYGRTVARCLVGDLDLGQAQVEAGHALAYRRYALDYVAAEEAARRARRGAWGGEFETPEVWRRARRG